jgi:hypothetical protein
MSHSLKVTDLPLASSSVRVEAVLLPSASGLALTISESTAAGTKPSEGAVEGGGTGQDMDGITTAVSGTAAASDRVPSRTDCGCIAKLPLLTTAVLSGPCITYYNSLRSVLGKENRTGTVARVAALIPGAEDAVACTGELLYMDAPVPERPAFGRYGYVVTIYRA